MPKTICYIYNKVLLIMAIILSLSAKSRAEGIGNWQMYPAYSNITKVEKAGTTLYVLASGGLFSYNTADQSVTTYDKTITLSDCQITHIAWCSTAQRLVIVYANYNIDLLDKSGNVINIPDYYNATIAGSKTVNHITIAGKYAYLATAFGILKINVSDAEVSNTYNLGFNIDWVHLDAQRIYAESADKGCYSALLSSNLLDNNNWQRTADYTACQETTDPTLITQASQVIPEGPRYNNFGFMKFHNGKLYTCGGGFGSTDLALPPVVQIFNGESWTEFGDNLAQLTHHEALDLLSLAIDPSNDNHLFAGGRTGLYEFLNGSFVKEYNIGNSPLKPAATVNDPTNKNYVIVSSLLFDDDRNLWAINSIAPDKAIHKYSVASDEWTSIDKAELKMTSLGRVMDNMVSLIKDSRNLLWFTNANWRMPALVCYQPSTDGIKVYTSFINEDGTEVDVSTVNCVAEDLDHNIWIGTNAGPLMLSASSIASGDETFIQVKVPRNDGTNLADYLLANVDITSIIIDGANRKWFGTSGNGVYLISADNIEQVQYFTSENSPLLSNIIESMAIDNTSGRIYFGTDKGLCSYRGNATSGNANMTKDNVWAYPNPVRHDYTGVVTITGLSYNADVKIVTTNGTLVASGTSNGGTFTWDCCDTKGRRVASGVYMVETATSSGAKGTVCKIAIIN